MPCLRIQMHSRNEIVEEARKWLGTPWRHQGRAGSGIDCCGLVIRVGNDLDFITYQTSAYSRRTTGEEFIHHFLNAGMHQVPFGRALPGDVLITADSKFPCHCGFIGEKQGAKTFIHAYARKRRVVEDPYDAWLPKAVTVVRFPGVE